MKLLSIESSCDDTAISIMKVTGGVANVRLDSTRQARLDSTRQTRLDSARQARLDSARQARLDSARQARLDSARQASFEVLANNSNSQIKIHIPYGGVYPVLAKREHAKNLPIILEASLKQAKLLAEEKPVDPVRGREGSQRPSASNGIDAIAVTYGPGLEMCLWEGILFAKNLAKKWNVPLIPVNHMEGHLLSVFGKQKGKFKIPQIKLPALALLVSGGHTQLVLAKKPASTRPSQGGPASPSQGGPASPSQGGWMQYEIIGESLDDAIGEAFDKVARMLDLPYPGGPQISKLAEAERAKEKQKDTKKEKQSLRGVSQADGPRGSAESTDSDSDPEKIGFSFSLPRPMLHSKDFNFSFSGLKTAVLYLINPPTLSLRRARKIDKETKSKIALEFENAAIECLTYKTKKALEKYGAKTLIVAGGVACNIHLQREMKKIAGKNIKLLFPAKGLSGDNSLMIGIAGYLNYIKNKGKVPKPETIKATGNLRL